MQLNDTEAAYITLLAKRMREANTMARKFDIQWNKLNDEINTWMDKTGILDPVQRAKQKSANLALQDAYAAGSWWRAQAHYLATAILAEKAVIEMTRGGIGWSPRS